MKQLALRSLTAVVITQALLAYGCAQFLPGRAAKPDATPAETAAPLPVDTSEPLNAVAADFVRLALSLGEHDADYVDAYHGPEEWRDKARSRYQSLGQINNRAGSLMSKLAQIDPAMLKPEERKRHRFLEGQLRALAAHAAITEGRKFSFDAESRTLYDVVAPVNGPEVFEPTLASLRAMLPGEGPLWERLERYRQDFVIPPDRLDAVFRMAIDECARRTRKHITLPANEAFTVEYVTDKAWSGYNWYQGDGVSLIQVNTDFPIYISRAIDLACHEGYPGHHVYNTLIEEHLVKKRGWIEFTLFPLFSPLGPIAEGSANFGIGLAFPGAERQAFEKEVLFPFAGLNPTKVDEYYEIEELVGTLNYAHNEAARGLLNGTMNEEQAQDWLMTYGLMSAGKAAQRIAFIRKYRSYVVNYNLGKDIVAGFVDAPARSEQDRWDAFLLLLTEPNLPSELVVR